MLTFILCQNNIITPYQSGFLKRDSTVNQLVYLSNVFGKALDVTKKYVPYFVIYVKPLIQYGTRDLFFKLRAVDKHGFLIIFLTKNNVFVLKVLFLLGVTLVLVFHKDLF